MTLGYTVGGVVRALAIGVSLLVLALAARGRAGRAPVRAGRGGRRSG